MSKIRFLWVVSTIFLTVLSISLCADNTMAEFQNMYVTGLRIQTDITPKNVELKEIEKQAESGDALSQTILGNFYYEGKGITRSFNNAFHWFSKAALLGNGVAQNNLGVMYLDGKSFPQNYGQAKYWFQRASDNRNAMAHFHLGMLYAFGWGVETNSFIAKQYIEMALDRKLPVAEYFMAQLLANGIIFQKNPVKAYELASLAAAHDYERADVLREEIAKMLTKTELKEAQERTSAEITQKGPDSIVILGPEVKRQ